MILRKLWFQTHWLLGITAGLILAVMGTTGALLSFENELLRALNPGLMTVAPQTTPMLSPPELIARLGAEQPQRHIGTISFSSRPDRAARVGFLAGDRAEKPAANARPRMDVHFVDPYSAAMLGSEDALRGHAFLHLMEDLHRRLAAGDNGKALTGASTLILLVLAGSGLYLRWPRRWRDWRTWLAVRWRQRGSPFLRSLHEVFGTWLLLPFLLVALTGLFWSYDWYRSGVFAITGATAPERQKLRDDGDTKTPDLHTAWSAFLRVTAASGYSSGSFNIPAVDQPLTINYLDAEPTHERASNRLTLDVASGEVRKHERYADKTIGGKIASSMFALHKGSFFGTGGTLVVMLASLGMPLFAITGWMLYLKRRRAARRRPADPVAAPEQALDGERA